MTDLIPVDASPGPKTHAFVIGVGRYPHLVGGDEPVPGLQTMGLRQLSSTVVSAKMFADWVAREYRNSAAPLGSVQLLLSPGGPVDGPAGPVAVASATLANVQAAFDEWFDRCSTDAGNIALFFFAGHGVAKETLALLLEDFGASAKRPFEQSIDFNKTHLGMTRCKASLQCYWVDSCRSAPSELLKIIDMDATSLITQTVRGRFPTSAPIIYATASDERAYGRNDQPTQFTKALLTSLAGQGSARRLGRWIVTPNQLNLAVRKEMGRLAIIESKKPPAQRLPDQQPSWNGEVTEDPVIHEVAGIPDVLVTVGWQPDTAAPYGALHLRDVMDNGIVFDRAPADGPWEQVVPAGTYVLQATLDPPYQLVRILDPAFTAHPPGYDAIVEANQ